MPGRHGVPTILIHGVGWNAGCEHWATNIGPLSARLRALVLHCLSWEFATLCGVETDKSKSPLRRTSQPGWQQLWKQLFLSPTCPRRSVQTHAEHEDGGGYCSHVSVSIHCGGERRQQPAQLDVPTSQRPQTFEAFQETLARA